MTEKTNLPAGKLADILALNTPETAVVDVKEWNCSVTVRALSRAEVHGIRKRSRDDQLETEGLMFVTGVVDPKFNPEHITQIMELHPKAVGRVVDKIIDLSGLSPETEQAADADFRE